MSVRCNQTGDCPSPNCHHRRGHVHDDIYCEQECDAMVYHVECVQVEQEDAGQDVSDA